MSAVMTKPRIGFVGLGWIGRHRLEALEQSGEAVVGGVADPALPETLPLEELLELDLDGVVIATPNALHAEQALAALERGIAVFCQKPLARNAEETRAVVDAAKSADRLLGVDLSYRHVEGAARIRELVRGGELGNVVAADLSFHNAYGPDKEWFYDASSAGGGCVLDLGTHLVDLALWTLDWPAVEEVHARLHGRPVEQLAFAQLQLTNGTTARIACSWHLPIGRDCAVEIGFYGNRAGATLRNVGGSYYDFVAELHRGRSSEVLAEPPDAWGGRAIVAWAHRLAEDRSFDPEIEHVIQTAETLDRIYEAAA